MNSQSVLLLSVALAGLSTRAAPAPDPVAPVVPVRSEWISSAFPHAVVRPLKLTEVAITGGYLGGYVDRARVTGTIDFYKKLEQRGSLANFRIVAEGAAEPHVGNSAEDAELYKLIEAAGLFAPRNAAIAGVFEPLTREILRAQDADGYLNTYYQNPLIVQRDGAALRFRPKNRFEFYAFGHLAQAGIAWHRSTGDDRLLAASLKFADRLCDQFESKPLPYRYESKRSNLKYEHPNHEMAMVELYRLTGNRRYLDFAAHTLDSYGFWSFPEVYGHCVQENYLLAAGADVYLETGKPGMLPQLEAMWHDIVGGKMYLTGGVGNGSPNESYGVAYDLPNAKSYCETCAAISKVFFDVRMLLATGNAKYADDLERTFYNAVLPGVSLTGTEYFYVNRMESRPGDRSNLRQPLFKTSCCPTNLLRLLGCLQQYLFTVSGEGVQVDLYGDGVLQTRLASGESVNLRESTEYPREGRVVFDVLADGKFTLGLRIPQWTEGLDVGIVINGERVPAAKAGEYARVQRAWRKGDQVVVDLPMKPRLVPGRAQVADENRKLALMRGPLVYCFESPDNPNVDIMALAIATDATFAEEPTGELGGTVRLVGPGWDEVRQSAQGVTAIPYHLWANRGESKMRIWMPVAGTPAAPARLSDVP